MVGIDEWVVKTKMFMDILVYWNHKDMLEVHLLITDVSRIRAVLDNNF